MSESPKPSSPKRGGALVVKKDAPLVVLTKGQYLKKLIEKQEPLLASIALEAMTEAQEQIIEGIVYKGDPVISRERDNVNIVIERQKLKDRKHEIEEVMHVLMTKYDLLSKKEYHEKIQLLQAKHKEIEEAIASGYGEELMKGDGAEALNAADLMGLEKRRAMTLAELAFAKSKEDLKRDQLAAEEFIKRMNEKRHEIERRKKEHKEAEKRKAQELEEKKRQEEEEKKAKAEQDRKTKMESLKRDLLLREEQRKKEREETKAKVDQVLNKKPLFKLKEEIIKEMEQSELEAKKENLKRLRSLSKPIDLSQLAQHKQHYLEVLEKKDKEKTDKREKILLEIEDKNKQDIEMRSKYNLVNRQAALDRYHKEREDAIEKERIREQGRKKLSERVTNYSRYVKEMYFPKVSQAKHDEIEDIISKLKLNLSNDDLQAGSPIGRGGGMRKSNSIIKLREIKSSLNTPNGRGGKAGSALKTLDKYAVAVKSILERNNEEEKQVFFNKNLNWKKKNPMIKEKYVRPEPKEYHSDTVAYLDEQRVRRKEDGSNPTNMFIDRMINDPKMKEYDRLSVVRHHAHVLEQKAQRDELVLMHAGDLGVDKEMEVNDMYLDAISAKLRLLDKI